MLCVLTEWTPGKMWRERKMWSSGKNNLFGIEDRIGVPSPPLTSWWFLENHKWSESWFPWSELCGWYAFPTRCKDHYRGLRVKAICISQNAVLLMLFCSGWLSVWLREAAIAKFILTQAFPLPLRAEPTTLPPFSSESAGHRVPT